MMMVTLIFRAVKFYLSTILILGIVDSPKNFPNLGHASNFNCTVLVYKGEIIHKSASQQDMAKK